MGLYPSNDLIDKEYGGYYTKPSRPLSVRFDEYPGDAQPYYQPTLKGAFLSGIVTSLTAYCRGTQDSLDYRLLTAFADTLSQFNVKLTVKPCEDSEFDSAVKGGKADIWIDSVPDGITCDKYEYYNSSGVYNYTGINDADIDALTMRIHRATGFSDRGALMRELLDLVMSNYVEYPLYQLQRVDIYDTSVISQESLIDAAAYDGYSDMLCLLY